MRAESKKYACCQSNRVLRKCYIAVITYIKWYNQQQNDTRQTIRTPED